MLGFASTSEARHVAEITNKLANFVIETDTEASIMPTDAGIVHIYWKIQAPFVILSIADCNRNIYTCILCNSCIYNIGWKGPGGSMS